MQVTTEQIDPCKIALTISVEQEKVAEAKEKAFHQFARNIQLPGFRRGKVPPHMARAYVDEGRVKQRAAEILAEPAYVEALEETKVEPFAAPDMELVEMPDDGPLVFKALVPLKPQTTLGPYKGLAIERQRLEVTDADVDRQIEDMRGRLAEYPTIEDRTAQTGDVLFADLTAEIEGDDDRELATPRSTVIEIGKNIPDFDNGLVGMAAGETKTIEAIYPEDFPDEAMRFKRATFTVTVKEIRNRVLPELNDEFAQKVSREAKTVEELRREVHTRLEKAALEMADNDLEVRLVNQIVQNSTVNYPDVLLRAQVEEELNTLRERLQQQNLTVEQWLEQVGRTPEQVEQEFQAGADRRIRNSLVLSEIARTEELKVEEADVEKALQERAERANVSIAAVRAFAEKNDQMDAIRDRALTQKVLEFLKAASNVTERVVSGEEMEAAAESAEPEGTADALVSETAAEPLAVESAVPTRRGRGKIAQAPAADAATEPTE